ncbi:MAG: PAS domain S-box protein [Nitrospiraceae bacterium]
MSAVVKAMGDAVVTIDRDSRVTMLNPAAEGLTGWSEAEAVGKDVDEIVVLMDPVTRQPLPRSAQRVLQSQSETESGGRAAILRHRHGGECRISDSSALIHDEQGVTTGMVMVFRLAGD